MWGETDSSKENGEPHYPVFTCCETSKNSRYNMPLQVGTTKNPARTYLALEYPRKCVRVCSSKNIPACTCLGIYQKQRRMGLNTKHIGFRIILRRNAIQEYLVMSKIFYFFACFEAWTMLLKICPTTGVSLWCAEVTFEIFCPHQSPVTTRAEVTRGRAEQHLTNRAEQSKPREAQPCCQPGSTICTPNANSEYNEC